MPKRFLLIITAMMWPFAAAADDATPTPAAEPTAAAQPQDATSNLLGPQTDGGGSSQADSAALQPAGLAPLQSTTDDATGLSAPSDALQAPATGSADLQVLAAEADGTPHRTDESPATPWTWLGFSVLAALLVGGAVVLRDRRRFRL